MKDMNQEIAHSSPAYQETLKILNAETEQIFSSIPIILNPPDLHAEQYYYGSLILSSLSSLISLVATSVLIGSSFLTWPLVLIPITSLTWLMVSAIRMDKICKSNQAILDRIFSNKHLIIFMLNKWPTMKLMDHPLHLSIYGESDKTYITNLAGLRKYLSENEVKESELKSITHQLQVCNYYPYKFLGDEYRRPSY